MINLLLSTLAILVASATVGDDASARSPMLVSFDNLQHRLGEPDLRLLDARPRGESVITHCQGGGRASVDAFVFERLGLPTRNYYLGWSDWGNVEDTPVETGPATGPERR